MENRSHALLAGVFTLVLLVAAALVAVWVGRDRTAFKFYDIVSSTPVSGLTAQSAVRYQGVPVGKVQSLVLNPHKPGEVRIRIGVAPTTPITASTWAEIGVQGVTGQANIELRDNGSSKELLVARGDQLPDIPLRPGFFDRLEQRGNALMAKFEDTAEELRKLMSHSNVEALGVTLKNTAEISTQLNQVSRDLAPALRKVGPLVDSLDRASADAAQLMQAASQSLARLNAPDGPLANAGRSLQDIARAAARLNQDTLPAMTGMANSVSGAARDAQTVLRNLGDSPQSLLFGPAPVEPGPGEPGFAGFRR
ncbi:MlaD family protein [Bordetella avium]|uniref:Exported protein n=1 Tax=Bordetella avium (strain 197N) TaxID=360910 RepID=Q2L1F9_BORA1|nr:MlaD family protein [Bordetella avium]AZY47807.1 MCE family protein [Bordetella avium]AZY51178.1 MCE family protein [Bordetella avium]RIQ14966.1 MCE family protein [Bordetella avium]RIQ18542.1 MCE family protein [Bordetella avium]RIQ35422.1 MCE family protein [Bordetella avium]